MAAIVFAACCCSSGSALAYSVLTHEEIVDLAWTSEIRPLLIERFPDLTEDQIKEAHAYAYGGSVIQDLGYYPFGSKEFSDLVHYVRTGDFVLELLRQSQDADEYAFAHWARYRTIRRILTVTRRSMRRSHSIIQSCERNMAVPFVMRRTRRRT
jgi:hypothetical protein